MLDITLLQSQPDHALILVKGSSIAAAFEDALTGVVLAGRDSDPLSAARSTKSIPPFAPLISSLRI